MELSGIEFVPIAALTFARRIRCGIWDPDSARAKYKAGETVFRWMMNQWKPRRIP